MGKGCRHLPVPTKITIGGAPHYQADPMKDGIDVGRHQAIGSPASDIGAKRTSGSRRTAPSSARQRQRVFMLDRTGRGSGQRSDRSNRPVPSEF
ncbi:hypothetical protein KSP40_PGU006490 [Platanthera guangdongensis]|uniref:Uncharacterized protein n=1 Tax=Platanthera guangdongensis TaxID=2320717 RepID=A0ABR2MV79_9ASPA